MSDFQISIEETGAIVRDLKVLVAPERVRTELERAYAKLRGEVQVRGFRKGKVPRNILEQRFGDDVRQDVFGNLIEEACGEAVRAHDLHLAVAPRLETHNYDADAGLDFVAKLELRPAFELGRYKGIEGVRRIARVPDEEVDAAIESLRERLAVLQIEEERKNVEFGDIVTLDMFGFDGDDPVAGTDREGVQIEVGAARFPEDFEKQLAGIEIGQKAEIFVDFEEGHTNEALAGKKIRFDVTAHEIRTKTLPDVDEDFVRELGMEEGQTVEDLKLRIREDLEGRAVSEADRRLRDDLLGAFVKDYEFELPQSLVGEAVHDRLHELGVAHDAADKLPKERLEEIRTAVDSQARTQIRAGYLLDAVAEAEGLETDKAEVEERIRQQITSAGERSGEVREHYSRASAIANLQTQILREKAVEKVVELSSVRDEHVDANDVADRQ
ncbi:MAG: trigger factor [Hyphomicrobiaceae bacterium]|jgi:trigger factor